MGDYKDAIRYYRDGLKLLEGIGDRRGVALMMANIGRTLFASGDRMKARKYLLDSLRIMKELKTPAGILTTLLNLIDITLPGDIKSAQKYLDQAIDLGSEINIDYYTFNLLMTGANFLLETGREKKAQEILDLVISHPAVPGELKKRAEAIYRKITTKFPKITPTEINLNQALKRLKDEL